MFDARARRRRIACCMLRHRWVAAAPREGLGFASRVRSDGRIERIDQWDDGAVREGCLRGASCHSARLGQKLHTAPIASVLQAASSIFYGLLWPGLESAGFDPGDCRRPSDAHGSV